MYHKIVVPLDGSTFAEQALSHAETIAVRGETEIHLVSIAPMLEDQGLAWLTSIRSTSSRLPGRSNAGN